MLKPTTDGVLFAKFSVEGGKVVRHVGQPMRRAILRANAERRKDPDTVRALEWGKLQLRIPELDLAHLVRKYPDLGANHAHTRRNAWLRFMGSSESDPYRLNDRSKARG